MRVIPVRTAVAILAVAGAGYSLGGWPGDATAAARLSVTGGVLEFVGIMLVALPEVAPTLTRLSAADGLRRLLENVRHIARRILRKRRIHHAVATGGELHLGPGTVSAIVTHASDASDQEKIAFLLRRDLDTQRRLNTLSAQVEQEIASVEAKLEARLERLDDVQAARIEELRTEYLTYRAAGVIALLHGVVFVSWGAIS